MPGLLDVVSQNRVVPLPGGVSVSVSGVSARGIAHLLSRFPEFRRVITGNAVDLSPESLVAIVPDAIAAVIAAGVGEPGDAETEKAADKLPLESQAKLLEAVIEMTMPNGVGPFVESLQKLMGGIGVTATNTAASK